MNGNSYLCSYFPDKCLNIEFKGRDDTGIELLRAADVSDWFKDLEDYPQEYYNQYGTDHKVDTLDYNRMIRYFKTSRL